MNFLEEMARLDDEWRTRRRRIDALVSDPCLINGAFLTGYKIAYYHALAHDSAEFQASYQKSMEAMMYIHSRVCMQAQAIAELHLHRDHSDPATWQAYPIDAAPLIRDLQNLIEQLRVHAAALRPHVPKKHHPAMDEPFERFSTLAFSLVEALEEASAFASKIEGLQTRGEPNEKAVKPGYKQTEVGVIPEEWEADNLGRYWGVTDCKHVTAQFVPQGFPLASIREVQSRFVELTNAKQTTAHFYNLLIEGGRKPRPGDLILSRNATVGEVAQVAEWHPPFAMGQDVCLLRKKSDEHSTEFLQSIFQSPVILKQLADLMVGSTFKRANVQQIRNFAVPMPPPPEQRAIATALSDVDGLLGGLDRLIAKKRDLKQAAMQQLLTGQTRLPGFHGEWEVKTLGEVAKIQRGASPRPIDSPVWFDDSSPVGWVRISDVTRSGMFLLETTQRLSPLGVKHSRPVATGSLIMSICATVGRPIITQIHVCIHDGFVVFDNLEADQRFLYYVLKWIEPDWSKHGQTGSQMNLNTGLINGTRISLPPVPEQNAIASVLTEMDGELAVLEQRREKTCALKQAMMQELLTGRTRLV